MERIRSSWAVVDIQAESDIPAAIDTPFELGGPGIQVETGTEGTEHIQIDPKAYTVDAGLNLGMKRIRGWEDSERVSVG